MTNSPLKIWENHLGIWEGTCIILDVNGKEIQRYQSTVTQIIVNDQWQQTNLQNYPDGRSFTQNFSGQFLTPKTIQIDSADPPFNTFIGIAEQHSEDLVIFQVWEKATQQLRSLQTTKLRGNSDRIRTTQNFNASGDFSGVSIIVETKKQNSPIKD